MISIDIKSHKYNCHLDLTNKITIVRSCSGTGKTVLSDIADKDSPAYTVTLSDSRYVLAVPRCTMWHTDIDVFIKRGIRSVFIIDDMDYVFTKKFSDLVKADRTNFYVIINRLEIFGGNPSDYMSCSDIAVRHFVSNGKEHYLTSEIEG